MFTPVESAIGGLIIGISVATTLLVDGKIAGCSGILGPFLRSALACSPKMWNAAWIIGMICGGLINLVFNSNFAFPGALALSPAIYLSGGLLVGLGTRLGKGCTSGHGLCGLARISPRSLLGVCTFMGVAALAVYLTKVHKHNSSPSMAPLQWPSSDFSWKAFIFSVMMAGAMLVTPASLQVLVSPLVAGMLFGLGLGCAGMTDQTKVFRFLDVTGVWDPSLAFVMGSGLCVTLPAFAWARQESVKPLAEDADWEAPGPGAGTAAIDFQLVAGATLFGFGWGLCGVCPGPAIAGAVPNLYKSWFVAGKLFFLCVLAICIGWMACDLLLMKLNTQAVEQDKDGKAEE